MAKVAVKTTLDAPAQQVWDLIGRFNSLSDWHPAIEKSELQEGGTMRRLSLVGGGEIVERLEAQDGAAHRYTYSILSGPLPVSNYTATIQVVEDADGRATVEWSSEFDPVGPQDAAVKTIQGVYEAGFANLKTMFGAK